MAHAAVDILLRNIGKDTDKNTGEVERKRFRGRLLLRESTGVPKGG